MSKASVNTETLGSARHFDRVQELLSRSLFRLSSGKKFVSAADDPQAIGLAEKLTAQQRRVSAASINVQNAVSYLQTADGLVGAMGRMVTRMSELSLLASDVMKNAGDTALYQTEFKQIQDQLRATIGGTTAEIGGTTDVTRPLGSYQGNPLFAANPAGQNISAGETPSDIITIPETNLRDGSMLALIQQDASGNYTLSLATAGAQTTIKDALQELADERGSIGAVDRRFSLAAERLTKRGESMTQSLSDIQDVDVAREATRMTKYQMLSESASTLLAQANQSPKSVLQLLRS
jgi:flagellin